MKYVLVTGAAGGMGRATIKAFRDAGFTVFALDKAACSGESGIIPIVADITNHQSLESAFALVRNTTDTLYAIVHLAGMYALDSLVEMDDAQLTHIFDVNVFGACRINKLFLPLLQTGSRIVITTSELAPLAPLPFTGIYAVTKSALDKYAFSLRMELQLLGIRVSVLRPGAVKTGMLGVSTNALDRFCDETKLYACNARRFRKIVDRVETRNISPETVAEKLLKVAQSKHPRYVYNLNRNPLLRLLNALPHRLQTWIIAKILK